ncbi:dicarboxylate/amino acid:cation symporter [Bacillus solimangrovi]|uniref:Sodium:proton antiporter n=1 Tax=Bacillus solimangrovi TaxID=1305675 RepID=A0A1E5LJX6_9BACI|nr:dicarboxylate/amino acid:cation symporter [Bacillus solimangrovi]OEH94336.1 sodium:proton antiporter [Bacillus solimangrovi]
MKKFGLLPRIILAIASGILIGSIVPSEVIEVFATFNGLFGNFLGFAIPLIIIGFIAPGIGQMGRGAGRLLGLTAGIAYFSTVIAGTLAYGAGSLLYPKFLQTGAFKGELENPEEVLLSPMFQVDMPPIMGVMTALLLSFTLGLGMAALKSDALQNVMIDFRTIIEKLISTIIIPLLPFHIFGIFANMTHGGQVATIMSTFIKVFIVIIVLHFIMLLIQYTIAGTIAKKNILTLFKNMIPAYFTALGTQSSASTIPVTLRQAKKNGIRERIADFVIPLCATIHLSGSTITLVSCTMAVMLLNGQVPTFEAIFPFILMLGITMIAAPGVPGGAVMAALGLLQSMLGFDATMASLMIALYLAQDSLGTATNVTGDGAISIIVDRLTPSKSIQ